jgi:antitoxin ParD1/3/4
MTTIANTSVIIRRDQGRGAEIEVVRSALIEGEKSGTPKRFDANVLKRKLRRVHR